MNGAQEINVYPNIKRTVSIVKLSVRPMEIELFKYIRIHVLFMDENNSPIDSKIHTIEGEDYKAWGNNDEYIIDWVKKLYKLGQYAV
jgi:hypothetical protein